MTTFFSYFIAIIVALLVLGLIMIQWTSASGMKRVRSVSLCVSLSALLTGVVACFAFNTSAAGFQFLITIPTFLPNNLTFAFGVDGLSMIFLLLSLFIFPICFLSA